jgi:Cu/Ag efflux protein CusF
MNRPIAAVLAGLGIAVMTASHFASAQPARGAAAAFERVRDVMNTRFKDMKLAGDPDRDFATLLVAHHEDLIFLAKMQLEHGGDGELRRIAQKIVDEKQAEIDAVKQWQVRRRQEDYRAMPDQPRHGSGPLGQSIAQAPPPPVSAPAAPPPPPPPSAEAAKALPLIAGTVERIDAPRGRITIDHAPIPNLDMDSMTMVFRVPDPSVLTGLKPGDRIRFKADRVNGQISILEVRKGR